MTPSFKPVLADPKLKEMGIHTDEYRYDYSALSLTLKECERIGDDDRYLQIVRSIAKDDLFFLMYFVLGIPCNDPFVLARIYEVQDKHHMTLDLWAREHWKSTILTYALIIWEWIQNPHERIVIFSHTRGIAKGFLRRIKQTLETNILLKGAYPNVFFQKPETDAPKWSENDGIYVRRPKEYLEASLEAWGLVDGMPTSKHYTKRIYDDLITEKSVATPDQLRKVSDRFRLSESLGARGGEKRVIGTRYWHKDTYHEIMGNKRYTTRIYPAEIDDYGEAKFQGMPVYMTREELDAKFDEQGEYIYSAQMLQNPVAASQQKFYEHNIVYYKKTPYLHIYGLCDPANTKKKESSNSVMWVVGVDALRNFFLLDGIVDKLDLGERWEALVTLTQRWGIDAWGYEKYSMQADTSFFDLEMERTGIRFSIVPLGGGVAKDDRIKTLVPIFAKKRFIFPRSIIYKGKDGINHDLITEFITEEYLPFPFCPKDRLDALARILDPDLGVTFPTNRYIEDRDARMDSDPLNLRQSHTRKSNSWMSA